MPADAPAISVVIPAFREEATIGATVRAVLETLTERCGAAPEVIVVDDGSPDGTAAAAGEAGALVIRQRRNRGKGAAAFRGLSDATGGILVLLDGDLGESAGEVRRLVEPLLAGGDAMVIAGFPPNAGGGFGLVRRLARWGLRRAGAPPLRSPLSGQRAFTRAVWERIGRLDSGFALEMGLNLDAARLGVTLVEVETGMSHRLTGRNWRGWWHRGRQLAAVARAIARRWGERTR